MACVADDTSAEHSHEPPSDEEYSVTPLELFFDLIFVFAFTQVTALMAHDLTWAGMVRGAALLLVVWWAWVGYSWLTNAVPVDDDIRARVVVFAAMAAGLVMGLAIPHAFDSDGVLFGFSYLTVTLLFVLLYAVATRDRPEMNRAVRRLAPGVLAAPVLVVVAGYLDESLLRAVLWTVALIVTVAAPLASGTRGWHVRPAHFAERHGLIIIIALGESVVALGLSASEEAQTFLIVAASVLGLVLVASLWWIYFDVVSRAAEIALKNATDQKRNALARDAYSYLHFFMVLGVVFLALGLKKSLLHVTDPLPAVAAFGLFGGVALYLLAHVGVRLRVVGSLNKVRLALGIVLLAAFPLGTVLPAYASVSVILVAVVGLIVYELATYRDVRHRLRHHAD